MPLPFVHLHVHTHYSLLDGACRIDKLIARTKELGMDSIAITDHGCMYGVVEFFNEAKKQGIKPILGMEAYMAPGDRRERGTPGGNAGDAAYHLLLLAQDLDGYKNLIKLSSIAYREGFYYKPRIDKDVLRQYSKGLIATSACLGGEVASAVMKKSTKNAKEVAETYADIFGPDRFFIEVQKHIKEQDEVNPELVEVSKKLGVGLVATNDVHFLKAEDHYAHDVLCCISMGRLVADEGRMKYPTELYLKSPDEMQKVLGHYDQAIENTARIAAMCSLDLDFSKRYAPVYKVPVEKLRDTAVSAVLSEKHGRDGHVTKDDETYLRQLCEEGLTWRYETTAVDQSVRDRLDYELKIIALKGFCSYFLIVWDFCNFAREHGIPVGARGSGVGTMVGYLLGLCNVDPLKFGLLFERFMDPSRNEMPDIDIDICQEGRAKIIDYVRQKYGHVAQIITFGTLAAKAACKDVGRVLGVPLPEIDRLTKLIPAIPNMTIDTALRQSGEMRDLYNTNGTIRNVIDIAKKLEGLCRNSGVHAAGVIIADQALDEIIPLCKDKDDNILTQFEGPISEKCGLLKMDFLGLRTLTVLQRSIDLVESLHKQKLDIEHIDFSDRKVLDLFCRGETKGVFQFESGGMQDLLMKMAPDRLEDLIAANALYRPGPMELIPLYCNRKHGREGVPSVHPIMDAILAETYGIMVYQEQVMQIFNQLGGIDLANAYKLIKAISKKTVEVIAKFKPDFIKGTMKNGVSKEKAEEIFDLILKFGGYGFNKSHSTRYAIVAFQTAYMKTYHPVEYMAALLTFEMGTTDKMVEYIEECRRMKIQVLPPDVNVSSKDFTPVYEAPKEEPKKKKPSNRQSAIENRQSPSAVIRFGMCAVRGVGEKAVETIIAERETSGSFNSLYELCERLDMRAVGKSTLDALIKCGAMNSLSPKRAPLLFVIDRAVEMGQQHQNDKRSGQMNFFGGGGAAAPRPINDPLPDVEELPGADLLKFEKEFLGFYITSHPLTEHQTALEQYSTSSTREVANVNEGTEVWIGGMINRVKKSTTKMGRSAGQQMANITLEDLEGQIDCTIWAEQLTYFNEKFPGMVALESIVFVRGKIDKRRETPCLVVSDMLPVADAVAKLTTAIAVKLDPVRHNTQIVHDLSPVLKLHPGNLRVYVQIMTGESQKVLIQLAKPLSVRPSKKLIDDVETLLGHGSVQLRGDGARRLKRIEQQKLFADAAPVANENELPAEIEAELAEAMDD